MTLREWLKRLRMRLVKMKQTILEEIQKTLNIIQECTRKECLSEEEKEETGKVLQEQYERLSELQSSLVSSISKKGKELYDL